MEEKTYERELNEEEAKEIEEEFNDEIKENKSIMDQENEIFSSDYSQYLKEIGRYSLLSEQEELELTKKYYLTRDEKTYEKLITSNLRLSIHVAKQYANLGIQIMDLIQEGNIGLMRGIQSFDPTMGIKLSTYCIFWIKQRISRYVANNCTTIRLPVHLRGKIARYKKETQNYFQKYNKMPSDEYLQEALGVSKETFQNIKEYVTFSADPISLSAPVRGNGETEDSAYGDFIASKEESIEDRVERESLRNTIYQILDTFPEREREILLYRYGFKGGRCWTLEEIGNKFGITRERIRQIETTALRRLRLNKNYKKLEDYVPGKKIPPCTEKLQKDYENYKKFKSVFDGEEQYQNKQKRRLIGHSSPA